MASDVLAGMIAQISAMGSRERSGPTDIPAARAMWDQMTAELPRAEGTIEEDGELGGVPVRTIRTARSRDDVVIEYLHGGVFCIGGPQNVASMSSYLADAAEATVVAVDYRLAPENPFPAAVDDCWSVCKALLAEGHDPARLFVGGDSAGGALTLTTLVAARDEGGARLGGGICVSPWVDLLHEDPAFASYDRDLTLGEAGFAEFVPLYVGGADPRSPMASPLYADLRGLPPILIQLGGKERLMSDALRLTDRLSRADVYTELQVWPEVMHTWTMFATMLPEGRVAVDRAGRFVRECLAAAV